MCKYCSNLGTGNCNDFIFEVTYPMAIGGVEFGHLCIDTLIIEDNYSKDDYDVKKDGVVLQTSVGTEDGIYVVRSAKRIKFCPFCGANLEEAFYGNAAVDVRNGIISNNTKYEVNIDSASGSTKPYVDKLRSNGFKVTVVDSCCDSEPSYAVEINCLDDLYKLINIVGHDVVINKGSDGCHEPDSITIYDYYIE